MADNYTTNPGALGDTFAADDIGGVKHPRIKISLGADGVATDANGDAANGLDVDVTRLPALPAGTNNIGDVDVLTLPAIPAGTNNIGDVDVITVPAPLSTSGGGLEAAALRVTIASDSTGLISIDDNGGSITIDGSVGITGAIPAGTNNIGDVDVLTLPAATNAGATAKTSDYDTGAGNDTVTMMGLALPSAGGAVPGGTSTNPVRTDPTGTTTQPISGSITNISGTVSLPTGASTLAEQQTQTTALQLIDDLVLAEDDPHISGDKGVLLLAVRNDTAGTLVSLNGDNTPLQTDSLGSLRVIVQNTLTTVSAVTTATSFGSIPGKLISAATTNATSIKTSGTNLYFLSASNINASPRYIKLFNKASSPIVGTDVPVLTFLIPGNTSGAGTNIAIGTAGIRFTAGLALAITTGVSDLDTGAVAANEIVVNYGYA